MTATPKHLLRTALAVGALVLLTAPGRAQVEIYNAILNGPNEAPPNASPATGTAVLTIDLTASTYRIQTTFTGLTGNTATGAAHIHGATPTPLAGVAGVMTPTPTWAGFPVGVTFGSFDGTFSLDAASSYSSNFVTNSGGVANARAVFLNAVRTQRSYLNIHTTTFAGGEIRGFFTAAAPEPGSLALLAPAALGAVAVVRRRRKQA